MNKTQRILTAVLGVMFMASVFMMYRANAADHCLPGKECKMESQTSMGSCCAPTEKK